MNQHIRHVYGLHNRTAAGMAPSPVGTPGLEYNGPTNINRREYDTMTQTAATVADPNLAELTAAPDALGRFGPFGGRFVPETIIPALDELSREYARAKD